MREIVLDTETTGFDPEAGHRIVEVGCLELQNHIPTGATYQCYVNPERDMPEDARAVHGLSAEFLAQHKLFAEIADEFLTFIGDAPLVIHNASFDVKFLEAELKRCGRPGLGERAIVDTLAMARRRFPGAQASLDALCRRFVIDNSSRTFHGALLDCELLAEVYLELCGGRQATFELTKSETAGGVQLQRAFREPRHHAPSAEEVAAHAAMLLRLKSPLWQE